MVLMYLKYHYDLSVEIKIRVLETKLRGGWGNPGQWQWW